jgi:hypothetical protein
MRFSITGLISLDASAVIDRIANPFADSLRPQIAKVEISCSASLLVYSPMIMASSLDTVDNDSQFRRRQSAIVIFRNVDHSLWMSASSKERLKLYPGALSEGLADLREGILSMDELCVLRAAIDCATAEVDAGLP